MTPGLRSPWRPRGKSAPAADTLSVFMRLKWNRDFFKLAKFLA